MKINEDVDPKKLLVRKIGEGGKIHIADAFDESAEELKGSFVELAVLKHRKPGEGDN